MMPLFDVQNGLCPPRGGDVICHMVKGTYEYYHYQCDGADDVGWGCGYCTLQTICSWLNHNLKTTKTVPSLGDIQQTLVDVGDKPRAFSGSKQWIGSFEICLVLDHHYNISSKILHARNGSEVSLLFGDLVSHFQKFGSPCMIGGDSDAASKTLLGVATDGHKNYFLISDPHFCGKADVSELQENGWIKWKDETIFLMESFYNFCLPQCKPV